MLISGEAKKNDDSSSDLNKKKENTEVCELSKSVSTFPTVSSVSVVSEKIVDSELVSSEKMVSSGFESSGSSQTVPGDESVNSSPSVMRKSAESDIKTPKVASVYDILGYSSRNIPIPVMSESANKVHSPLIELPEDILKSGKSEYELWMLRRDKSVEAAKELEKSLEKAVKVNVVRNDDVRAENVGECGMAAAQVVKSDHSINPNRSEPLDAGMDQGSRDERESRGTTVGPVVKPGMDSPFSSGPGMCKPNTTTVSPSVINENPSEVIVDQSMGFVSDSMNASPDVSPNMEMPGATLPSAVAIGTNYENESTSYGLESGACKNDVVAVGPAGEAKAQKKVSFADVLIQGGNGKLPV
ncbi:hypothetical protein Hanom_Chr15g01337501 [Helianthus anomalus]